VACGSGIGVPDGTDGPAGDRTAVDSTGDDARTADSISADGIVDVASADTLVSTDAPRADATGDTGSDGGFLDRSRCTAMPDVRGMTTRSATGRTGMPVPYLAYAPASYDRTRATTIVIALHGAGDVASNYFAAVWRANADALGFLVVAPDGSCPAGPGNTWCNDDGNSIIAVINDIERCYSVDVHRRIINGFSAGGIMAYSIGLQVATSFAGISISAANLGSAEAVAGRRLLPARWTIPVSHFHGLTDTNFPIATARDGWNRLEAAGHTVYRHEFDGGHTTNAGYARTMYMDLMSAMAP